jgi:SAM-dependent methyltransferase
MSLSGALTNTTAKQQQQQGQNPNPSRPPGLDTPVGRSSNRSVVTEPTNTATTTVTPFPDRDSCRVLIVGCGNSTFGLDMLHDGWAGGILNVDFSASVIGHMRQVHGNEIASGRIDYICADVTEPLDDVLAPASFDLIVCKGTLDAVLCQARHKAVNLVRQCVRLLAPGHGVLAVITSGNPDCRLEYLEHENELSHYWRGVSVHTLKENDQQGKHHGHSQPVSTPSPQGPGHGSSSNNTSQLSV